MDLEHGLPQVVVFRIMLNPLTRRFHLIAAALAAAVLFPSCSLFEEEEKSEWTEDAGLTRVQKWQKWEREKGEEMWEKFKLND